MHDSPNTQPIVYADGYGRWHAIVRDTPRGVANATRLIAEELFERSPSGMTQTELLDYVALNIVSRPDADHPEMVHFIEYGLPDEDWS